MIDNTHLNPMNGSQNLLLSEKRQCGSIFLGFTNRSKGTICRSGSTSVGQTSKESKDWVGTLSGEGSRPLGEGGHESNATHRAPLHLFKLVWVHGSVFSYPSFSVTSTLLSCVTFHYF